MTFTIAERLYTRAFRHTHFIASPLSISASGRYGMPNLLIPAAPAAKPVYCRSTVDRSITYVTYHHKAALRFDCRACQRLSIFYISLQLRRRAQHFTTVKQAAQPAPADFSFGAMRMH